jgi:fructose-specific phosphotransferase system component IIB
MFERKDVNNLQILLESFTKFKETLIQVKNTSTGTLNEWISKEITSAELVISSLDYELDKLRNGVDDDFVKVELDGINVQMKVYQDALKDCSDETEGKILDKLIELKKAKIDLEKKINKPIKEPVTESKPKNKITKTSMDSEIPDDIKEVNARLVDKGLDGLDIQNLADTIGVSLFYCIAELRGTIEEAVKKSYLNIILKQSHGGVLSEEKSEHFLVQVVEKDDQLGVLVFINEKK